MDSSTGLEYGMTRPGEFFSCGVERGTEILRQTHLDGSLSGVVFKYDGGLLTARHVVEANRISGFTAGRAKDIDIAYRLDMSCQGLPLGYVDKMGFDGVEMVTSALDDPENLVVIPGRVGVYFLPTLLHPFQPRDPERAAPFFKPGASGSPLIYKDHIVGLVPWQNLNDPYEVAAVVFSGRAMKEDMERLGLAFEEVK